jgi:hypothetical protein
MARHDTVVKHPEETIEQIKQLALDGKSATQIAKILKISRSGVLGIAHRRWGGLTRVPGMAFRSKSEWSNSRPKDIVPKIPKKVFKMEPPPRPSKKPVPYEGELYVWDLKYGVCRWPTRQDADVPKRWLHCGKPVDGASKYCAEHRKMAHVPSHAKVKTISRGNHGYRKTEDYPLRVQLQQDKKL